MPHLLDGAVLDKIEKWILWGGYNLEKLDYTFENCQMKSIDKYVFQNCSKVTSMFHTFHRCNKLQSIPEGLFDSMTKIKTVNTCFKSCIKLSSVPDTLFSNCKEINDFSYCFCGGGVNGDSNYSSKMQIKTNLPPIWNTHPTASHSYYAHGCIYAKNYK